MDQVTPNAQREVSGGGQDDQADLLFEVATGKLKVKGKALVTDAPMDGNIYARRNAAWLKITEIVGPEGKKGDPGLPGERGRDGNAGIDGKDGAPGSMGPEGRSGKPGIRGADSTVPGPPGPAGPPGKDGKDGKNGKDGKDGAEFPDAPADDELYGRRNREWVPVPEPTQVVVYSGGGSSTGGGIPEAPADGQQYARQNADWSVVVGGGGGGSDTAAQILAKLVTVDGTGSTLDADLLDGQSGAYYLDRANHTGTQAESTIVNLVSDLAAKAPLASPVFTGDPQAPTPTAGDSDTSIATTAFVANAVAAIGIGGMSTAEYTYSTTTTTPPSTGQLRGNNATQSAITAFYLHETNAVGIDITNALKLIAGGVKILVQDKTNSANVQYYVTSSAAVDNGAYFTIPVTWTSTGSGSAFTAGRVIFAGFGIGSNNMLEAPTDGTTYGRRGSDASWQALPKITVASIAPSSPGINDIWIDTT